MKISVRNIVSWFFPRKDDDKYYKTTKHPLYFNCNIVHLIGWVVKFNFNLINTWKNQGFGKTNFFMQINNSAPVKKPGESLQS